MDTQFHKYQILCRNFIQYGIQSNVTIYLNRSFDDKRSHIYKYWDDEDWFNAHLMMKAHFLRFRDII